MKIKSDEYKGFNYTINFTNEGDWGKNQNKFMIDSSFDTGYFSDFEDAEKDIKTQIDKFIANSPKNEDEWLKEFDACIISISYEDYELDKTKLFSVANKYADWKKVK